MRRVLGGREGTGGRERRRSIGGAKVGRTKVASRETRRVDDVGSSLVVASLRNTQFIIV